MFRKGGSAGEGITSGLQREGFAEGSTRDRLMKAIGPSRSSLNDFLINFGLNMVSGAPTGNILQTAATQAKEPYAQFSKDSRAEQDLMRKISLEAETLDIGQEQALELQALKNLSADNYSNRLKQAKEAIERGAINPSTGEPFKDEGEALMFFSLSASDRNPISTLTMNYVAQGDDYKVANNKANWDLIIEKKLTDSVTEGLVGGQLPTNETQRNKLLKKQSSIGKYFYDIKDGKVKKFNGIIEKEGQEGFDFTEVDQTTFEDIIPTGEEVIEKDTIIGTSESGTKLSRAQAEVEAEARGFVLIPLAAGRGEGAKFKRQNPDAISIVELQEIIDKENMAEKYAGVKQSERIR